MTPEHTNQLAIELLLSGFMTVLALGILITFLVLLTVRRHKVLSSSSGSRAYVPAPSYQPSVFEHSCRWLAVKTTHVNTVQTALGLHNPTPCSWGEGMSQLVSRKLFVSPPIRGWIIVVGQGIPDPAEDVDRCYHFIVKLSLALGQVQFFGANRALNHHAWIRADHGNIRRAYAWAGETLWNQGNLTQAEIDLELSCYDYGETPDLVDVSRGDSPLPNSEKIFSLAARWSFDPSNISENTLRSGRGVVGDLTPVRHH